MLIIRRPGSAAPAAAVPGVLEHAAAQSQRLLAAVHLRFGLPAEIPARLKSDIKRADAIAAYYEARLLAGFGETEALTFFGRPQGVSPDGLPLSPWPAEQAQKNFLKRFRLIEQALALRVGRPGSGKPR